MTLKTLKRQTPQSIIDSLEKALAYARENYVSSMYLQLDVVDNAFFYTAVHTSNHMEELGMLEFLKSKIIKNLNDAAMDDNGTV